MSVFLRTSAIAAVATVVFAIGFVFAMKWFLGYMDRSGREVYAVHFILAWVLCPLVAAIGWLMILGRAIFQALVSIAIWREKHIPKPKTS